MFGVPIFINIPQSQKNIKQRQININFFTNNLVVFIFAVYLQKKANSKMRKAFNFYRSYYDILPKIKKDEDKLAYLLAILDRQFLGIEPTLEGDADFAYTSQLHSINKSVEGWENKTKTKLVSACQGPTLGPCQGPTEGPTEGPCLPPTEGPCQDPWQQEEEEGKEEGQEQGEGQGEGQEQEQVMQKSILFPDYHSTELMYHNLSTEVQKEADRQAELAFEKLFNKKV